MSRHPQRELALSLRAQRAASAAKGVVVGWAGGEAALGPVVSGATRREHPSVFYPVADERVVQLLGLGRGMLADNAEHVAACGHIDGRA